MNEIEVPVVEISPTKLVVELGGRGGGGHLVDLVNIMDKIRLRMTESNGITIKTFDETKDSMRRHDSIATMIEHAVREGKVSCVLPLTQVRVGGRPTKSRRTPRRRRVTRRTTRRRRV